MKIRILGCSGGIGGSALRTTALLVDDDILIDAGTGVGDLKVEQLAKIDHVFLTHAHLDHIACLPMLIDTVGELRQQPLIVHATRETLKALKEHIFNWAIWPDFSVIPSPDQPFLRYQPLVQGEVIELDGRRLRALPAVHTVPAVGYQLDSGRASLVFTGDTTVNPELWPLLNAIENLRVLIIETAFPDGERELALVSKHLCPSLLTQELKQLQRRVELYITHLKPSQIERTFREIQSQAAPHNPQMLQPNQIIRL